MLKMYVLTVLIAGAVGAALSVLFHAGPIADHQLAIFFYGGTYVMTFWTFLWNVVRFKRISLPPILEAIRIPFGAVALGVNSAYSQIRFADPEMQLLTSAPYVKNIWLAFEIAITISLITGIYRWGARSGVAQPPLTNTLAHD